MFAVFLVFVVAVRVAVVFSLSLVCRRWISLSSLSLHVSLCFSLFCCRVSLLFVVYRCFVAAFRFFRCRCPCRRCGPGGGLSWAKLGQTGSRCGSSSDIETPTATHQRQRKTNGDTPAATKHQRGSSWVKLGQAVGQAATTKNQGRQTNDNEKPTATHQRHRKTNISLFSVVAVNEVLCFSLFQCGVSLLFVVFRCFVVAFRCCPLFFVVRIRCFPLSRLRCLSLIRCRAFVVFRCRDVVVFRCFSVFFVVAISLFFVVFRCLSVFFGVAIRCFSVFFGVFVVAADLPNRIILGRNLPNIA